jgi:hypothetical protein
MRTTRRLRCPDCGRLIAAYVPSRGDATADRIVKHNTLPSGRTHKQRVTATACPGSGRLGRYERGAWVDL